MTPEEDFVILAPYSHQEKLLQDTFPHLKKEQRILTVHKSQGREWDTVFLSICDSTSEKWFTDSNTQRGKSVLNTAVSRAKKRLIIVCDTHQWIKANGQMIQEFLKIGKEI